MAGRRRSFTDADIERLLRSDAELIWPRGLRWELDRYRAGLDTGAWLEIDEDVASANDLIAAWEGVGDGPADELVPLTAPSPSDRLGGWPDRRSLRPVLAVAAGIAVVVAGITYLASGSDVTLSTDPASQGGPPAVDGAERTAGFTPCFIDFFQPTGGVIHQLAYSPDGSLLGATSINGTAWLFDTGTGAVAQVLSGHAAGVIGIAFHPDGTSVATTASDGTARLWDVATGAERAVLRHRDTASADDPNFLFRVAFSPDGALLATTHSDGTLRLWDSATGAPIRTLTGHAGWAIGVAFSPDGSTVASGGTDDVIQLWDVATGENRSTLVGHSGDVGGLAFDGDGTMLASAGTDGTVRLWDPATGQSIRTLVDSAPGPVFAVAFSSAGLLASTSMGDVQLWDPATGANLQSLPGYGGDAYGLAFSPDGTRLAVVDSLGRIGCYCQG
ncbi:MAG: WD40 repeat domain-containing protein [Actinomycetota bacterium]